MTDDDAIGALREIADHLPVRVNDPAAFGIERLRAAHALMGELMLILGKLLHDADEKELAEARARVAEIEARLKGAAPEGIERAMFRAQLEAGMQQRLPRAESKPSPTLTDYDQTDAGMGIIEGREPAQSADDFRDELAELREHGVEKRRKRGI